MSYRVDYETADGGRGTVIHRFTTKREATAFAKFHMDGCNRYRSGAAMTKVTVAKDRDPADKGWLHGRLVSIYPMNF